MLLRVALELESSVDRPKFTGFATQERIRILREVWEDRSQQKSVYECEGKLPAYW